MKVNQIEMSRISEIWAEGFNGDGGISGSFHAVSDSSPIDVIAPVYVIAAENDEWSTPPFVQ